MKPFEQTETTIHLETKIGHVLRLNFLEFFDQLIRNVVGKLPRRLLPPFGQHSFGEKRRELFLQFVREPEIEPLLVAAAQVAQDCDRLARIVIAVVIKENDFAPDFALQAAGGLDFREKKTARKNPARLLSETNNWRQPISLGDNYLFWTTIERDFSASVFFSPKSRLPGACNAKLGAISFSFITDTSDKPRERSPILRDLRSPHQQRLNFRFLFFLKGSSRLFSPSESCPKWAG